MIKSSLFALVLLGACGSDPANTTIDAAKAIDAPAASVVAVTCPATPAAEVTTAEANFSYSPAATTIMQGQIVRFTMSASHNVVPGRVDAMSSTTKTDSGMNVGFNATKCLMFTQTGAYGYHCGPHMFNGTVTVQ
jgi:plastocyanin